MGKAEKTKQFIIEKAAPIFNERGIAGTSISDIMVATNLAKGGIYGNFATKEEISVEAFDYIIDLVKRELKTVTASKTTAKDKLFAILDFYLDYSLNPVMKGGCPILNFGVEADDTNPLIKKKIKDMILYFQHGIKKLIQMGKANNEFNSEWNEDVFAIYMFALIEGGILVTRILENNSQMTIILDNLKQEILRNTK